MVNNNNIRIIMIWWIREASQMMMIILGRDNLPPPKKKPGSEPVLHSKSGEGIKSGIYSKLFFWVNFSHCFYFTSPFFKFGWGVATPPSPSWYASVHNTWISNLSLRIGRSWQCSAGERIRWDHGSWRYRTTDTIRLVLPLFLSVTSSLSHSFCMSFCLSL